MAAQSLPPVLVVDDSEEELHLIKRLLAKAQVKNPVVTFDDASRVMTFLKAASATPDSGLMPCILFTDLKMPGVDGLDLVKWIRTQKSFARLPVVMLSGSGEDREVKRAKELGVTECLTKLPTPETLSKVIANLCGRRPKAKGR